ncbi:MAG: hypothetical protein DRH04_10810 [Deltaproteobacteria bacterium]|nr:MAG: hypothetical protein DRH04_10810 [Deltaproteobacteria bacterium]
MKAQKYIVIGKYDSERNSWIPGGDIRHVCSSHRSERAAWEAAERHHYDLGGCDGSDLLTDVMVRGPRLDSRAAKVWLEDQKGEYSGYEDYYEHEGYLYFGCDYWSAHHFEFCNGGIWAAVK